MKELLLYVALNRTGTTYFKLFLLSVVVFFVCNKELTAQDLGAKNLSRYNQLNVFADIRDEIPVTLLATPVTRENVLNYVESELNGANIPYNLKSENEGSPLLFIRLVNDINLPSPDCSTNHYGIDVRIYETINGSRYITYCWVYDRVLVNNGVDGKANGVWESIREGVSRFVSDWRNTH